MKPKVLSFFLLVCLCATLLGCGGGNKALEIPLDMPKMCHEIDFNINIEIRELCGVKVRSYRSYKNIPQYRILMVPKNGKIVKKAKSYELRLQKMLPISLPNSLVGKLDFNEKSRRTYVKSSYDYHEFLTKNTKEMNKIFKITIPFDDKSGSESVCYTIVKPKSSSGIKKGYASQLETLNCERFEQLKAQAN